MSTKKKPVPGEVDEARMARLADDVEAGAYEPVRGTLTGPLLAMGRPVASEVGRGNSPVRTVRFPRDLDQRLIEYTDTADITLSDLMRNAVAEYLDRHPLGA